MGVRPLIDCAFNSNAPDEVYLFCGHRYLLLKVVLNSTADRVLFGPANIIDFFPSLRGTIFATGIDSAFKSSRKDEAYIFKRDQYALLNFAPGTTNDYIIYGPMQITNGFHCLKGTPFATGIDAAFNSSAPNEAYIFRGKHYARINYAPHSADDYIIEGPRKIIDGFPSLKATRFANGIDAAFKLPRIDKAVIFKGEDLADINFAPGTTDYNILYHHGKITDGFLCLKGVLPMDMVAHH